ncbi:unnamed protein product [Paramecium sonneborni]|uniref:Uncharacterized protein n=1 Tax=Paramecium sonneborni TaxID=65129 RepID=A0A8S1Q5J8_9CILI|nr:unnamed protein product [Paramecium sonneborni]
MCNLQQEKHQFSMYLSGGGKRKLCLDITLIGNSQKILKRIKQDRCIILTTHHLKENQELQDYVGIIYQGKVTIFGTVDYIKKQFSVGYIYQLNVKMDCIKNRSQIRINQIYNKYVKMKSIFFLKIEILSQISLQVIVEILLLL